MEYENRVTAYVSAVFKPKTPYFEQWQVAIPQEFNIHAQSVSLVIKGAARGSVAIILPFQTTPGQNADRAIAPAMFCALTDYWLQQKPQSTVQVVLLAGNYLNLEPFGAKAWLHRERGRYPDKVVWLDLPTLYNTYSPRFSLSGTSATEVASITQLLGTSLAQQSYGQELLGRKLTRLPQLPDSLFEVEGIPLITLVGTQSSATQLLTSSMLAAIPQIADMSDQQQGSHFLALPFTITGPELFLLSEVNCIVVLLVFYGLYALAVWFFRNKIRHSLSIIKHEFWRFLLFAAFAPVCAIGSYVLTVAVVPIIGIRQWWDEFPLVGLMLQVILSIAILTMLYVLFSRKLPGTSAGYAVMTHGAALLFGIGCLVIDTSIAIIPLPVILISFPTGFSRRTLLTSLRIILITLYLLWLLLMLTSGTQSQSFSIILRDSFSFAIVGMSGFVAIVGALILARISMRFSKAAVASVRTLFLRIWSLSLATLVAIFWIVGLIVLPERLVQINLSYTEVSQDPPLLQAVANSGKALSVQADGQIISLQNGKSTQTLSAALPATVSLAVKTMQFLSRKLITLQISHDRIASAMQVYLLSDTEIRIFSASMPYKYESPSQTAFFIGPYPPQQYEITFEVPSEFSGSIVLAWDENRSNQVFSDQPAQISYQAHFRRLIGTIP